MGSIWEWVGEQVGYGLAAVILGPGALVERKARREARRAVLRFARAHEADVMQAPPGTTRRMVRLPTADEPLHVEVSVELTVRHATLTTALPDMPVALAARASCAFTLLHPGIRFRIGPARAAAGNVRLDGDDMDDETANELVNAVAAGPLNDVTPFEMSLREGRAELLVKAPATEEEWERLAAGLVAFAAWTRKKWAHSYRT